MPAAHEPSHTCLSLMLGPYVNSLRSTSRGRQSCSLQARLRLLRSAETVHKQWPPFTLIQTSLMQVGRDMCDVLIDPMVLGDVSGRRFVVYSDILQNPHVTVMLCCTSGMSEVTCRS